MTGFASPHGKPILPPMANKPDHTWRIHLKARPARQSDTWTRQTRKTAIDKAIEEFKIDPRIAERLVAERWGQND